MVEKLQLNNLATALVDIPAATIPIVHSLICGIVLFDKTALGVASYCPEHKVYLYKEHAV
jgi:hypothetical protein